MRRGIALFLAVIALTALTVLPSGAPASVTNTIITSGPSGLVFTSSVTFTFTSPEGGGFECRLDSGDAGAWQPCSSPQSYPFLEDGPHVFEVRALNDPGHPDPTPAVAHFAVDTAPPETEITAAPTGTVASSSAELEFASDEPGSFECRLDSGDAGAWQPCSSPQSYSSLADGPHSFEVFATNEAGIADPTPAIATWSIDTTPPETTITAAPSGQIETSTASFEFEGSEPGGFECRLDSGDAAAWQPCSSPQPYSSLADGQHAFEVRASDALGNTDPTPAIAEFSVYTGPPPPVAGESFDLEPVEGTIELQCPGEDRYSRLTGFKQVPVGCLINARRGIVDLTASKGRPGDLQGAHFWGGVFIASQEKGEDEAVDLKLAGRRMCERRASRKSRGRRPALRKRRGKRGGRKVWGSGKGNYTTNGSYGSATVRGTTWLVVDRCDSSTLFKVSEGTVWVQDFVKHKQVVLEAGEQYVAKAEIPRLNPNIWH
jgi:hypothetical protein